MSTPDSGTTIAQARRTFWVTAGLLGVVLILSISAALPANVLLPDAGTPLRYVKAVMPQGWAFFTKDPQDVELVAYRVDESLEGGLVSLQATPQSLPKNLFGLSRAQRAQGPEIAAIANELDWTECVPGTSTNVCRENELTAAAHQSVAATIPHPFLCGPVLVVQEKPVAWSFREFVDDDHTAVRIALADITCPNEVTP